MPQASDKVRKKFLTPGDDGIAKCEEILKKYNVPIRDNAWIIIPDQGIPDAPEELEEAVEYLCDEWDYGLITEEEYARRNK